MLSINNPEDKEKMRNYYRVSDMINLLDFFPEVSPVRNLTIVENEQDYYKNRKYLEKLDNNRVDSLKGRPVIEGLEASWDKNNFVNTIKQIKEKDPLGVLVLFNVDNLPSQRYERYAGISVGVDVGENVYIDAVGKGFDGREVSKSICAHERYCIPWYKLRGCCIENFKQFQTYETTQEYYIKTRNERTKFLESIGLQHKIFSRYIPEKYEPIPNFIWLDVITNILKKLEKSEERLLAQGFSNFAISGHTEGKHFRPWQMFDKTRYQVIKK